MKKIRSLTITAVAALGLAGCATGTGGAGADVSYDPDATLGGKLSILGFGGVDEIATTRLDLAKEALGSDVSVKLVEGDLDIQQLLSSIAAGDPPELIYANRDQLGSLAARGAIIPLDDCIDGESIDSAQYLESALDQVTFNGEVYGIPEFNTVEITMANSGLLSAAGVSIDAVNGSDWAGMTAANSAMASPGAVIGVDPKLPEFFPLWAQVNGVDLLSEDGRTANLNDPAAVEALETAVSLYDDQGGFASVKAFRDSADFFGAGNQYATNVLGSMWMEQWYVNVLNDVSPDAPMTFDVVRTPDGDPVAFASGSAWAIPSGSDNAAAACRFARVMTETDSWLAAAQARIDLRTAEGKPFTGLLTANAEADEQIRQLVTDTGSAQWDSAIEAIYLANDNTFSLPANPADAEFKTAWQDGVNRVLNGQQSAQESLDDAQEEAQAALDEAWAKLEK